MSDDDKEKEYTHPSYGMISLHRVYGDRQALFGSKIPATTFMTIQISEAKVMRSLHEDRYYSGERIAEVHLTAAQFAEMISVSMNTQGVPCTLQWTQEKGTIPPPPALKDDHHTFKAEIKQKVTRIASRLKSATKGFQDVLDSRTVTKGALNKVWEELRMAIQDIEANLPFVQAQVEETAEKTLSGIKIEAEATIRLMLDRLGKAALATKIEAGERVSLTLPEVEKKE